MGLLDWVFNTPQHRLEKAVAALEEKDSAKALVLLAEIQELHPQAPLKIAEIKWQLGKNKVHQKDFQGALSLFQEVCSLDKQIKQVFDRKALASWATKAAGEIAEIHYYIGVNHLQRQELSKAELAFMEAAKWCSKVPLTQQKVLTELARMYFAQGKGFEKERNYNNATEKYTKALTFWKNIDKTDFYYEIGMRIEICQLKQGRFIKQQMVDLYGQQPSSKVKQDLMYRYALQSAQLGKWAQAESIIGKYLPKNHLEVKQLLDLCQKQHYQAVKEVIEKINKNVFSEDVKILQVLYQEMDAHLSKIRHSLPNLASQLEGTKTYLFSRLIGLFFEQEDYELLLQHIESRPLFFKEPELLKNAALTCFQLVAQGRVTQSNYKTIISTWLTAIYANSMILNSIKQTSWDDDYTFTLIEAIGARVSLAAFEVENVNYEAVSASNISIGATQRVLMEHFETNLNKISDEPLLKQVLDFFNSEQAALTKVIQTVQADILYPTPHFAVKHNLESSVLSPLARLFEQKREESLLEMGLPYAQGATTGIFATYTSALTEIQNWVAAIQNQDLSVLKSAKKITAWDKWDNLKQSVQEQLMTAFSELIEEEEDWEENFVALFEEAIRLSPAHEQLKLQCAEFIVNLCVAKLNEDEMEIERGLELMIKSFMYNPDNERIANNLAIITKRNCYIMLEDEISDFCRQMLISISKWRNDLLSSALQEHLGELLKDFFEKLINNNTEIGIWLAGEIGVAPKNHRFQPDLNDAGKQLLVDAKLVKSLIE